MRRYGFIVRWSLPITKILGTRTSGGTRSRRRRSPENRIEARRARAPARCGNSSRGPGRPLLCTVPPTPLLGIVPIITSILPSETRAPVVLSYLKVLTRCNELICKQFFIPLGRVRTSRARHERGVAGVLWREVRLVACRATPRPAVRRLGVGAASSCRQLQPLSALRPPRQADGA